MTESIFSASFIGANPINTSSLDARATDSHLEIPLNGTFGGSPTSTASPVVMATSSAAARNIHEALAALPGWRNSSGQTPLLETEKEIQPGQSNKHRWPQFHH